jgi:hypothetical protein
MGKRRRRRTRSDEGGRGVIPGDGPVEWPGLTGPSVFTFEGRIKQMGAVSGNLARARGARGAGARFFWLLSIPPAAMAVLVRDLWRWLRGSPTRR